MKREMSSALAKTHWECVYEVHRSDDISKSSFHCDACIYGIEAKLLPISCSHAYCSVSSRLIIELEVAFASSSAAHLVLSSACTILEAFSGE